MKSLAFLLAAVALGAALPPAVAVAQGASANSGADALNVIIEQFVKGTAPALALSVAVAFVVWKTWRQDAESHKEERRRYVETVDRIAEQFSALSSQVIGALDRQTAATRDMSRVIEDLDRAIRDRTPPRA